MDDKDATFIENTLSKIGVRAKVRDLCGRCERPIGKEKAALCNFAPYAGMRLHVKCISALIAESVEEES